MNKEPDDDHYEKVPTLAERLFGEIDIVPLEGRIFNVVAFLAAVATLFTFVSDIVIGMPIEQSLLSLLAMVICAAGYGYSRKTGKYQWLVLPVIVFLLVVIVAAWFSDGGLVGGNDYYLLIIVFVANVVLEKRRRRGMLLVLFATVGALLYIDLYHPNLYWVADISREDRVLDTGRGLIISMLIITALLQLILRQLSEDKEHLREAIKQINDLRTVIPICMTCKKIRNEKGEWYRVEDYIARRDTVTLTHGLCPECLEREKEKKFW